MRLHAEHFILIIFSENLDLGIENFTLRGENGKRALSI